MNVNIFLQKNLKFLFLEKGTLSSRQSALIFKFYMIIEQE